MDRNPYIPLAKVRHCVALRKESVDRNLKGVAGQDLYYVALRKESVDRNGESVLRVAAGSGRSPQGERG